MISIRSTNTAKSWLSALNHVFVDAQGPLVKGIYRGLYELCTEIKEHFVSRTSLGRDIWGGEVVRTGMNARGTGKSNLGSFIRPMRVLGSGGDYRGGIEMQGIPALVEMGGRTKPHAIAPRSSKFKSSRKLSLGTLASSRARSGGRTLVGGGVLRMADGSFVRWVKQHSARVPAHHFAGAIISRHQGLIADAIERRLARDLERLA